MHVYVSKLCKFYVITPQKLIFSNDSRLTIMFFNRDFQPINLSNILCVTSLIHSHFYVKYFKPGKFSYNNAKSLNELLDELFKELFNESIGEKKMLL